MTPSGQSRTIKRPALMTVDFEDYRRQELARQLGGRFPANPAEVERQLDLLLEAFAEIGARATFFSVGRLTGELQRGAWTRIGAEHEIGCHGHDHVHVFHQGHEGFLEELRRAKSALEDTVGRPVISFRAPMFSADDCDPWFGEALAETGFRIDSSRRIFRLPEGCRGTCSLPGGGDRVVEVPLPCIGVGLKRLTVIGGTYFRLLSLGLIRRLLARAERLGFHPLIYLHPYDLDPAAEPLDFPGSGHWKARLGDRMRRTGRRGVVAKLRALADIYDFRPVESLLEGPDRN